MTPELAELILRAAVELRETADAGEHPAAATRAVRAASGECERLCIHGRADCAYYERLAGVLSSCETAERVYVIDPERVSEVLLPAVLDRLTKLVQIAEAVREAELCAC